MQLLEWGVLLFLYLIHEKNLDKMSGCFLCGVESSLCTVCNSVQACQQHYSVHKPPGTVFRHVNNIIVYINLQVQCSGM